MRTCPKCHEASVADDGYCGGRCREITMPSLTSPPCSVERATRSVIEHKLLTALEDENCVAALLSKRDLDDMISALYGFEDMGHDGPRKKRCKELADSMSQLRREAFPPNDV